MCVGSRSWKAPERPPEGEDAGQWLDISPALLPQIAIQSFGRIEKKAEKERDEPKAEVPQRNHKQAGAAFITFKFATICQNCLPTPAAEFHCKVNSVHRFFEYHAHQIKRQHHMCGVSYSGWGFCIGWPPNGL